MVATPGNSLNITAAGLVKFDGTSAFTGVTTTQHDLLIGAASNGITSVAPSATSGVPVISQGASADPTFGTAVVAGGGTGAVTLTNHGVLLGQGTSAIVATAAGSSGQVLQSGGASADPAYSTATYPATATGTGKILRADGTNWVATTATYPNTAGTSGNVLTSDGTNWNSSAPATGGNLVLIQSQTASNSASLSFTTGITSTYNTYLLVYTTLPVSNLPTLQLQVSTDGGSTYKNTSYQTGYNVSPYNSAGWGNGNSTTLLTMSGAQTNTANRSTSGFIYLTNLASANYANFNGEFTYYNGTPLPAFGVLTGTAVYASVNAFQITESSGNISSGTFTLFGILE